MALYECWHSLDYSVFSRVNIRLNEVFQLKTKISIIWKRQICHSYKVTDALNSNEWWGFLFEYKFNDFLSHYLYRWCCISLFTNLLKSSVVSSVRKSYYFQFQESISPKMKIRYLLFTMWMESHVNFCNPQNVSEASQQNCCIILFNNWHHCSLQAATLVKSKSLDAPSSQINLKKPY